jgi:hypothetical protein
LLLKSAHLWAMLLYLFRPNQQLLGFPTDSQYGADSLI